MKNTNQQKIILIADDNRERNFALRIMLEDQYRVVEVCCNGLEAVKKVKENKFDLIIINNNMPIMDGEKAVKQIRKIDKDVPILMTVDEGSDYPIQAREIGVDEAIINSFDTKKVQDTVHNLLVMRERALF